MKKVFLSLLFLVSLGAQAVEYNNVIIERSSISFTSRQMGVPADGRFNKFSAAVKFDPAKPEAGQAVIEIDMASVDAGNKEVNDEVVAKGWFNAREFPKASFVSESFKALGNNRYEARGKMSIKGKTRDMSAVFVYRADGANGIFEGALPLMRTQFGIGDGPWADTSVVADEVTIKFVLVASNAVKK